MSATRNLRNIGASAALAVSLLAAPAAQAQARGDGALAAVIAAQGNQALRVIRAEVQQALHNWKPQVEAPRAPAVVRKQAGATGPAATARCAE